MKVVILAGGKGTRISEETRIKPKPMIEIGGKPMLWHIMKIYSHYGFNDFIICCGYKGNIIKDYFINYYMYQTDSTFLLKSGNEEFHDGKVEPWRITLANTDINTLTAGRILKIREYIGNEPFMLTYGDGVSDVNIRRLLEFHQINGKIATITVVKPLGRFGGVQIDDDTKCVKLFREKAREDQAWVNAGFMVLDPTVFKYLGNGNEMLEDGPFERIVKLGQMSAFQHAGFWSPMDNIHDRNYLETLWSEGNAPWKKW